MVPWPWLIVTFTAGFLAAGLGMSWRWRRKLLRILEQFDQSHQFWQPYNERKKS